MYLNQNIYKPQYHSITMTKEIKYLTIEQIKRLQKMQSYKPQIKKVCLIIGLALIGLALVTPATNWTIPIIIKEVIYR